MKARITVTLKNGVLDPQGKAIEGALASLGFDGVGGVRQGKVFDVDIAESDPARAAEACLNFVEDQQALVFIRNLAQPLKEAVSRYVDAPFALNRLDDDRRRLGIDHLADFFQIARGIHEAGHQRFETFVILRLRRCRHRRHRSSVKAFFEGEDFVLPLRRVQPGEFDRRLRRLGHLLRLLHLLLALAWYPLHYQHYRLD